MISILRSSRLRVALVTALVCGAGQAFAAGSLTVFESRMPDGRVVLGDSPVAGAKSVKMHKYEVPASPSARSVADSEREYWRQQAEGFERRQRAEDAARARALSRPMPAPYGADQLASFDEQQWQYPQPVAVLGGQPARPLVPLHLVPRTYTSSPGAVNGRGAGFIGSGFSTAR
ncbi:MAG: hypothetical protein AB7P21_04690 [Lautropia sp.]